MGSAKAGFVDELSSLRGIAALLVCISHTLLVYPLPKDFLVLAGIPLNPHGAVVLFFVLSGFVLALSWQRVSPDPAGAARFYVRRAFRIFPAMWLITALAALMMVLSPPPSDMSGFSAGMVASDPAFDIRDLLPAMFARNFRIIPPTWTIYIELIGSLLIPALVWLLARDRRTMLAGLAALVVLSYLSAPLRGSLGLGLYMVYFGLGIALALHAPSLTKGQAKSALGMGVVMLTIGRALYFAVTTGEWQDWTYGYTDPGAGLIEAVGATLLLAGIVSGSVLVTPLRALPLRFLGAWSYSFYLIHAPVMRVIAHTAPAMPPLAGQLYLTLCTITVSVVLAAIIYRAVELPGIALGKRVTSLSWPKHAQPAEKLVPPS